MGKRKRDCARRMNRKPKKPSPGSSSSGGGGGASIPSRTAVPPTPSSAPPSSGGGRQGPTGTPPSSGGGTQGPRGTPPSSRGGTHGPTGTPPPSSASSASSGHAGATGGTPSPTHAGGTPPSTSSRSSSSSSGGYAYIPSMAPPAFLTRRGPVPKPHSQYDQRYAEAEVLLSHLETHCKEAADELWGSSKWHLKIDFFVLRKQDRQLSHQICNKYQSGGKEFYISAVRTFLLDHLRTKSLDGKFDSVDALKSHIETHTNLSFTHMPKSITTFSAITKSIIVKIFAGENNIALHAVEATPLARKILCKIMQYVLEAHKKEECWDGNWSADDWDVLNDNYVSMVKEPIPRIGREHSDKDLVQIATSILPTFKLSGSLPSFMQHLHDELNNLPLKQGESGSPEKIISDTDFFGWYYSYIRYHPATMSPLARANLLQGFYFTMDKLDYRKKAFYNAIFNVAWLDDWRVAFYPPRNKPKVQYDVFWYKQTPNCTVMPHEMTYGGMLGYHRHLVQHSPDNGRTKMVKGLFIQAMTNSDEAELVAALHNEKLLPEFIKKLFVNKMMTCPEFLKHWHAYVATRFIET